MEIQYIQLNTSHNYTKYMFSRLKLLVYFMKVKRKRENPKQEWDLRKIDISKID